MMHGMVFVQYERKSSLSLPLYGGWICAGFPSPAEDYMDKKLDLNDLIITHPASTFFVRASGNSMIGAGIFPNSLLVVDRYPTPKSGQVVVAVLNGDFTVKRFLKKGRSVSLVPENKSYRTIEISEDDEFSIWGVVIQVLHDPSI